MHNFIGDLLYVFHFIAVVALVKLVLSQFLKEKKKSMVKREPQIILQIRTNKNRFQ